jgi:hypothetical protein
MTGAVLDSIPQPEHLCTSVYNIAFDPYTSGGPYIWAFAQEQAGNEAKIHKVSILTHQQVGLIHDATLDLNGAGTALAGGLSVTWRYDPDNYTLMGVCQNSGNLFGYELADYSAPAVDASTDSLLFNPPYTIIPDFEVIPYDFTTVTTNLGTNTLSDLESIFYVSDGFSQVFSPASQHSINVVSGANATVNFFGYTPTPGAYQFVARANTVGQTDLVSFNDSMVVDFAVSDTVYARDNTNPNGSLGIGDGTGGTLGQIFELANPGYISSVNFLLNGPTTGDITSVDIYDFTFEPNNILASTPIYTFTGPDSNGVALTLMIAGGPLYVPAGTYFVGVNETAFNVTLANTPFNYRNGSGWVTFTGQPWSTLENLGQQFAKTFILRLDVLNPNDVGITKIANETFKVYPTPASTQIHFASESKNYKIELFDVTGRIVQTASHVNSSDYVMNVSSLSRGIYNARITASSGETNSIKISVQR